MIIFSNINISCNRKKWTEEKEKILLKFLDEHKDHQKIANGNTFDLLLNTSEEIVENKKNLVKRLNEDNIIWICGDRDPKKILSEIIKKPVYEKVCIGEVLIMNGYQFDIFNTRLRTTYNLITRFEKFLKLDRLKTIIKINDLILKIRKYRKDIIKQEAINFIKDCRNINKIILGYPSKKEIFVCHYGGRNISYFNSGYCLNGDYVQIQNI